IRSGRKFDRCDHEGIHPRASAEPRGVDSTNRYTATSVASVGRMTQPKRFQFTSTDGLSIACMKWGGHHDVRGAVQIAHGLGEHMGRYTELAEKLVDADFVVYGNDHRGHGLTAKPSGSFGEFGPGGFDQLVEDMISLRVIAKNEHPRKPYILLGHSLGSFAAQQFVLDHSHSIGGLALAGSGILDGLARLADPQEIRKMREDLPVYIFSGSDDPVGQRLEGVRVLIDRYRSAGLTSISHDFYSGGRHEMLHETNRRDVITNLLVWMSAVLKR